MSIRQPDPVKQRARLRPIRVKRVYDELDAADGIRVLVDRLWPRGVTKARAAADFWLRDAGPERCAAAVVWARSAPLENV